MLSHVMIGSNDLGRSKRFYDAIFQAAGLASGEFDIKGRLVYPLGDCAFMVSTPLDGGEATPANGGTIGFALTGPEMVDAWHKAGIANGGVPVEDPPGIRELGNQRYYLAYLRDPDGNKLNGLAKL